MHSAALSLKRGEMLIQTIFCCQKHTYNKVYKGNRTTTFRMVFVNSLRARTKHPQTVEVGVTVPHLTQTTEVLLNSYMHLQVCAAVWSAVTARSISRPLCLLNNTQIHNSHVAQHIIGPESHNHVLITATPKKVNAR